MLPAVGVNCHDHFHTYISHKKNMNMISKRAACYFISRYYFNYFTLSRILICSIRRYGIPEEPLLTLSGSWPCENVASMEQVCWRHCAASPENHRPPPEADPLWFWKVHPSQRKWSISEYILTSKSQITLYTMWDCSCFCQMPYYLLTTYCICNSHLENNYFSVKNNIWTVWNMAF